MNNFKPLLIAIAWLLLHFLSSCKKDPIAPLPTDPTIPERQIKIAVESLPGIITPQDNMSAVISITNKQGQAIVTDKNVQLVYENKYLTPAITLPEGDYRITKFLIYSNTNTILYASPLAGSAKANEVTSPLAIAFNISGSATMLIPVYVTTVNTGNTPQQFGYPAGTFTAPADQNTSVKIRVRAAIKVGDIMYDSIPCTIRLTTWNLQNQATTAVIFLRPGFNDIYFEKAAIKHQLSITKWNVSDQKTLLAGEITDGMAVILGGTKPARKLSAVNTAILTNGIYKAYVKKDYTYSANGKIAKAIEYKKDNNNETVVSYTEDFFYNPQNHIQRIQKKITAGPTSEDVFEYRSDGRLQSIQRTEPEGITSATVNYQPAEDGTEPGRHYTAGIQYAFTQHYYTQYYNAEFYNGNIILDNRVTSHGDYMLGRYEYDFCINPYAHLNIPDLYFENSWKHNRVNSMQEFENIFPLTIAYENSYTYDGEGYPTQLITKYRKYLTGEFSHQTKSVFYYN